MSDFTIEKDWITESGLRAVAVIVRNSHRCGYVGVDKDNPLYGVGYDDPCEFLPPLDLKEPLGKRSIIPFLWHEAIGPSSPSTLFDVHGGITYSGSGNKDYPVQSDLWWLGFDCGHSGDAHLPEYYEHMNSFGGTYEFKPLEGQILRSLEYVVGECESLAKQIQQYTA